MARRAIDRRDWAAFVDGFSRRHEGWLISVAVEAGTERRYLVRDVPLHGVVAEVDEAASSLMVFTGQANDTHFVERPASMAISETPDAAETELTITDRAGVRTVIEVRSPMRPELVDGIAS